jgi:membrane-bound lytic murein transglycosylase D
MNRFAAFFGLLIPFLADAQGQQVPHKMHVAGITLSIRDDARREIQKEVDALTQYPRYFNIKVERAKIYFPIIEQIFREERVPDDFKYLVLQESALIADAVSVSNAVGFWQFKDFTAMEMGLRVDQEVDERMNIVSSTRAAAQYLKKNNYYFNNWLFALQAYQMGAGAVMRAYSDYQSGAKHMEITSNTYWYVKKFLAHKIAFEGAITGTAEVNLLTFTNHKRKTLGDIAREIDISEEKLSEYNKWVRKSHIPDDRRYAVIIPVESGKKATIAAVARINEGVQRPENESATRVEARPGQAFPNETKVMNGIPAIKATAGETAAMLAKRAGIGLSAFLKFNDLSISDPLVADAYYYTRKKKSQGAVPLHRVDANETLWLVSQRYGIQLRRLKKINPGLPPATLSEGTLVYLVPSGPKLQPAETLPVVEVDAANPFNWVVSSGPVEEIISPDETPDKPPVVATQSPEQDKPADVPVLSLPEQHIVSSGETLYGIAKKYNVSVLDLTAWNNLSLEQGIKPGQVLRIQAPEGTAQPASGFFIYEVKSTDTLYSVARQHGVTIKQLLEWNGKSDFTLSAGEKLKILRQQP